MSGLIPQDVIDTVLAAHDVVEVVGRYVPLKSAGRSYKALCPFHDEKTPSFTVNPDRQTYKCFGCGKGGNVFRFLMDQEGLTFPEAVRLLAKERAITIPDTRGRTPEEEGRVEAVRRALASAQAFFVKHLLSPGGTEARAYLAHRGYDAEAIRRFGLGYAPPGWDTLLQAAAKAKILPSVLEDAGLVVRRDDRSGYYDRFRHRVIFPIADLQGRVVTFGARALGSDDNPKYLNGPETVVFKKANTLYALDRARESIRRDGDALLMEGYTDVLMCHLHGLASAVAGMGTAFTPRQAMLLKRFAKRVILVYDGDEAGQTAAERTLDILLPEGLEVRACFLPVGRDIDEILLEEGREAVDVLLGASLDVLDFKLAVLARRHDLETPEGRARVGEALAATIVKHPSPVLRDQLMAEASERLGGLGLEQGLRLEAGRHVREEVRRGTTRRRPPPADGEQKPEMKPHHRVLRRNTRETEIFLLAGLILIPDLRDRILRAVGAEDFQTPVLERVYNAVLRMEEAGEPYDLKALTGRMADDAEAQAVLAGLPEDENLDERIPLQIEFLEAQRRKQRQRQEILESLGMAPSEPASDLAGEAEPESRSEMQRDFGGSVAAGGSDSTAREP